MLTAKMSPGTSGDYSIFHLQKLVWQTGHNPGTQ